VCHNFLIFMPIMVLVRGLPGSGKTTFAKKNFANVGFKHFETDMFFTKHGVFNYVPALAGDANEWCQRSVRDTVEKGLDVVVSNLFTRHWEMGFYLELAQKHGYDVIVHTCSIVNKPSGTYPEWLLKYLDKTFEA